MALSKRDFDYYKDTIKEDEQEHRLGFEKNCPSESIAAYEGLIINGEGKKREIVGNFIEDYLFVNVNTIIPGLYYQVPQPNIRPINNGSPYSAEVLNGLARHYFDEKAKKENQRCILDAYLAYGYAVAKTGYNARTGRAYGKSVNPMTGKTGGKSSNESMESGEEYFKYEGAFVERVSPKDCFLDASKEFGKGQRITFRYERTLQEIIDSNMYNLGSDFLNYFKSRTEDNRKIKLIIKEHWCIKDGYAWKLVYTDDWHQELYWDKSGYKYLPCSLLRFNETPDTLYPVSHGRLASLAQKELNYLNEIWKEHIDKVKRQHLVYKDAITEEGLKTLKHNEIDGIVYTNMPVTNGVYAQISSNTMGKDVYANIDNVRMYLEKILSTVGAVSGSIDSETATQERIQQAGNAMRTSGLQDSIRDFNNDQLRKIIISLINFGRPELTIRITGKNVIDPFTGEPITGRKLMIGGARGVNLQEQLMGSVEEDYLYDVDMQSASRPDYAVVRKQLLEGITLAAQLSGAITSSGKKINIGDMIKDYFKTFDSIPNPDKYIQDMTPEELQGLQQQQEMSQAMEFLKNASESTEKAAVGGKGIPEAGAMDVGANAVPTAQQMI